MAIQIDGTNITRAWPTDQALVPLAAVDYYVKGTNETEIYFPLSTLGTGDDEAEATTRGASGTDKIKK